MAKGRTAANPHFGAGRGTQYFIEELDKKIYLTTGKIIKYGKLNLQIILNEKN